MTSNKPSFLLPVSLTILALVLGFYSPKIVMFLTSSKQESISLPTDPSQYCALTTQGCTQNSVTMQADTDVAKPLMETSITADWKGNNSPKLLLTLQGKEMDLGIVKFPLTQQESGQYQGSIILPICTDAKMTWIGTLTDEQGQQIYTSIRMEK